MKEKLVIIEAGGTRHLVNRDHMIWARTFKYNGVETWNLHIGMLGSAQIHIEYTSEVKALNAMNRLVGETTPEPSSVIVDDTSKWDSVNWHAMRNDNNERND